MNYIIRGVLVTYPGVASSEIRFYQEDSLDMEPASNYTEYDAMLVNFVRYRGVLHRIVLTDVVICSDGSVTVHRGRRNKMKLVTKSSAPKECRYVYIASDIHGNVDVGYNELGLFNMVRHKLSSGVMFHKIAVDNEFFHNDAELRGTDTSWWYDRIHDVNRLTDPKVFYDETMRLSFYEAYQVDDSGNRYRAKIVSDLTCYDKSELEISNNWDHIKEMSSPFAWSSCQQLGDRYCGNILEDSDARI